MSNTYRGWKSLFVLAVAASIGGLAVVSLAQAQGEDPIQTSDLFEFGDGGDPLVPGTGDVLGEGLLAGPDWDDLFDAQRQMRDVFDEFGNAGSNGVPDFLDTFGNLKLRRDAVFLTDAISAGSAEDPSVLVEPGRVGPGLVASAHDLGNAYAYSLFDGQRDFLLYAGVERLAPGAGRITFEFNQSLHTIGGAGEILGDRTVGDLRVVAEFSSERLVAVTVSKWELVDAQAGLFDWVQVESLPVNPEDSTEQCNAASTLCTVCNGSSVGGGSWPSYGADGSPVTDLPPDHFMEIGLNLSSLLSVHTYDNYYSTRYTSMQLSTFDGSETPAATDYALGAFVRASRLANR